MSTPRSPIKDILQTLSRHAGVVEQSLAEVVFSHGDVSAAVLTELLQVSALRAAGPDGYRLHPRLRDYLQDNLQIYPSHQNLAEIGSKINSVLSLWGELDILMTTARSDFTALESLESALRSGLFEIVDSMERNMMVLQILVSTRYGNVKSLALKQSQNRFYQGQTAALASDLVRLSRAIRRIEEEATRRGLGGLVNFIGQHLLQRLLPWQQGVSEIQTHIRNDIFRIRQVEQDYKLLARMDMLMRQQPSWRGFDPEFGDDVPVFLLAAKLPALKGYVEPQDSDRAVSDEMRSLVEAMPPKRVEKEIAPPVRYKRLVREKPEPVILPGARALNRLVRDIEQAERAVSLNEWRESDADAQSMSAGVWLVFAAMALRSGGGMRVNFLLDKPRAGEYFAHRMSDALACTEASFQKESSC